MKSGTIQFEPQESTNIFKKLYSKIATDLVKKLIIAPNNFYSSTTRDNYADIFNNEKVDFQLLNISEDVAGKFLSSLNTNEAAGMDQVYKLPRNF